MSLQADPWGSERGKFMGKWRADGFCFGLAGLRRTERNGSIERVVSAVACRRLCIAVSEKGSIVPGHHEYTEFISAFESFMQAAGLGFVALKGF